MATAKTRVGPQSGSAEDGEHFLGGPGVLQLLAAFLVAEETGECGKRLEVALELALRREEEHAELNGLVVQRLEINRRIQPRDNGDDVLDAIDAGVGEGDTVADAGAVVGFAVFHRFADSSAIFRSNLPLADQEINQRFNHSPTVPGRDLRDNLVQT